MYKGSLVLKETSQGECDDGHKHRSKFEDHINWIREILDHPAYLKYFNL
jgi:hypothetical protein